MSHSLHSSGIRPLVRFAGIHHTSQMRTADTWAADCRMFYFTGSVHLNAGGSDIITKENDLLILPPQCSYRFSHAPAGDFFLVNFDYIHDPSTPVNAIPTRAQPSESENRVSFTDLPMLSFPVLLNLPGLVTVFTGMSELYKNKYLYFHSELNARMTLLLTRIFRILAGIDNRGGIGEIIDYVRKHCTEDLSAADIAKRFHYHPNYVSRMFLRHTGQPLHRYLVACRIEMAQQLLFATQLPIAQIAGLSGFASPADFSRAFRRTLGCTPSDFRK